MTSARPKILQRVRIQSLRMDVAARHHARVFRTLALVAAFLYFIRGLVAFSLANVQPTLILCAAGASYLGLYALGKKTEIVKNLTIILCLIMLGVEAGLVDVGATHFIQFLLIVPLAIISVALLVGMLSASVIALIATVLGIVMVRSPHILTQSLSLLNQGEAFRFRFFFYLIGSELLIVFIIYLFQDILAKSEQDVQLRRVEEARSNRRSALAETIGKAAHELNNPLAILDGAFRRLKFYHAHHDQAQQFKNLEYMRESVDRLKGVLENIRIFVEGDLEEPFAGVTGDEVISAFLQSSREKLQSFGIFLQPVNAIPRESIVCRPRQIQFVLQVFLENAIEAMKGPIKKLGLKIEAKDNQIKIELEDNGIGIAPEDADKIFTPFFTTKAVGKTIGMNLSISRVLIQEQGGSIGFEPKPEGGTRFYILLKRSGGAPEPSSR